MPGKFLLIGYIFIDSAFLVTSSLAFAGDTPDPQSRPSVSQASPSVSQLTEEVQVWADPKDSRQAGFTNPVSVLTPEDRVSINVVTTEDIVKYEPSLVIRRRFIGDANGTLGICGSNMFQTSRSMVFADGVPLHYFLQSRWNGAPRWTMVSASEIAQVEVLYRPFQSSC